MRSSKTKSLFLKQKRGPQLASLRACNKAAVAFKKCGFVQARPSDAKTHCSFFLEEDAR